MKTEDQKKKEGKLETEELLNSELEQVEGGACQCDTGAGQIVFVPSQPNTSDSPTDNGTRQV